MMGYDVLHLGIAALAGLACGFFNAVASSGSVVSLPTLMWMGLHAIDANATNRIPVLIGGITATIELARNGKIPWKLAWQTSIPVTLGSACGAGLAEMIPSHDLRIFITAAVLAALVLILTKLKDVINAAAAGTTRYGLREKSLFFLVGIWLGFIVLDGATYLLLVLVLAVRLPLIEANAIKNFLSVPTTIVAMVIFASRGSVDWTLGGILGIGSIAGSYLGARLALSENAKQWIMRLLIFVIVGELLHLGIRYYLRVLG
ncbi:sulfite exporter TauE/SafE family protein [Microvirga pudoricolor]|uniref:sulfite exporter TauE/SafE family protein n=1 Tax=Microvirga pudoricolor TaxID=2778729 RepID=UPI00194E7EFD|nr:sulfite exporter TauE/SafE family protein [Microvirga pudoricolor]MBM6596655.1 sulfite exporter TauE/SafE family protein [Microvirga pudoricolor]